MKSLQVCLLLFIGLLTHCSSPKSEGVQEVQEAPELTTDNIKVAEVPPIENPKNIIDYYILLKWKEMIDPFSFIQRDGQWICTEDLGDDFDYNGALDRVRHYPAVVDIKNAYLQIEDEGTGGGTSFDELALFRKSDKSYILAVAGYSMDDPTGIKSGPSPRFYIWQNNDFKEVTKDVFPEINESMFFEEETEPTDAQKYFTLPQFGRTIINYIQLSAPIKMKKLKRNKIEIQFNSNTDRFEIKE